LVVAVADATNPRGLHLAAMGGPGNARLRACSTLRPILLSHADEIVITCNTLTVQVLAGPVEIELTEEAIIEVPTGATVTVTELGEEQFEIQNSSPEGTPPILIVIGDEIIEVAPGESLDVLLLIPVLIDIKPGRDPNAINPFGQGVIPVAILGSESFDVNDVDVTSLAFGPDGAAPTHDLTDPVQWAEHLSDVNEDGLLDLLSHYSTQETGIAMGDEEACLTGETLDGIPLEGCDAIATQTPGKGCGFGAELALLLPPLMWLTWRRRRRI
jgi:hypothetical protein